MDAWDGASLGELFDVIRTTMPQNNPNSLSPRETTDLIAYILQTARVPPGTSELPTALEPLQAIRFAKQRP